MSTDKKPTPKASSRLQVVRHVVPAQPYSPAAASKDSFHKISQGVSNKLGSPMAFGLAALLIVGWAISGPFFDYSDTWQLVINTSTTIVTFLMVFAIQNTQNRDSRAMQLKLSELIRATKSAHTEFIDIEDLPDTEIDAIQKQFRELHERMERRKK